MPSDDAATEREIQAKGLTAPRVTPADIEANIAACSYFTAAEGVASTSSTVPIHPSHYLLTLCVLVTTNGFTVVGKSACASPENFDQGLGRRIAYEDAKSQLWALMGYALKDRLHAARQVG